MLDWPGYNGNLMDAKLMSYQISENENVRSPFPDQLLRRVRP
jgi:hypothetical protein